MKKLIILSLLLLCWEITFSQNISNTSDESIRKIIRDKNASYNRQDWASMKKFHADSVKVYEFPNSLRDSTSEGLVARYPKTFAKYPENKIEIMDIYNTHTKDVNKKRS